MDLFLLTMLIMAGIYVTGIFATAFILGVIDRVRPDWNNLEEDNQGIMFFWPLMLVMGSIIGVYTGIMWIAKKIYSLGARQPKFVMPDNETLMKDIGRELEIDSIVKELDEELGLEPTPLPSTEPNTSRHINNDAALMAHMHESRVISRQAIRDSANRMRTILEKRNIKAVDEIIQTVEEHKYDFGP